MNLQIATLSGATINICANSDETVLDLKKKIAAEKNTDASQIKLIYNRKMLQNDPLLANLGITDMARIVMVISKSQNPIKKPEPPQKTQLETPAKTISPFMTPIQQNTTITTSDNSKNGPRSSPLPLLASKYNDPPDFDEKVKELEAMGYDYGDCCQALRAALYSMDMASNYLISGYIPDIPQMAPSPSKAATIRKNQVDDDEFNNDIDEFDSDNNNNDDEEREPLVSPEIIRRLYENPSKIKEFLNKVIEMNPDNAFIIKNNPALFLAQIGIDPSKFDLTAFQNQSVFSDLMGRFSKEDQDKIKRISEKGYDTMMVIQFFEACDKNEELTIQCLGGN